MIILQKLTTTNHRKSGESKYDRKLTELDVVTRAVARTLIGGGGGGGCLFIYSCSVRLVSCQINKFEFDFKRN